jgi:hypothetical protein
MGMPQHAGTVNPAMEAMPAAMARLREKPGLVAR